MYLNIYWEYTRMYICTMGLCIMGLLKSYVVHINNILKISTIHKITYVYYEYINLYTKYIMSILYVYLRFILFKLNDFDITIPINVY